MTATGGLPNTASYIKGVQVKDNVEDNKNDEVSIMWEVLRHSLGDFGRWNIQDRAERKAAEEEDKDGEIKGNQGEGKKMEEDGPWSTTLASSLTTAEATVKTR